MTIEQLEKANSLYKEIKEITEMGDRAKKVKQYFAKLEEAYTPLESCKFQIGDSQALSFYLHPEIINGNTFVDGYIEKCEYFIILKEIQFENL